MRVWLTVLVLGCTGGTPPGPKDTAGETGETGLVDTAPIEEGTDEDGDGFTVEDGDCDDDNIWVNPGWDEDPADDQDNDCDGRIDEIFSGLLVVDGDATGATDTRIRSIDAVGDQTTQKTLTGTRPRLLDENQAGSGFVTYDSTMGEVRTLQADGTHALVASVLDHTFSGADPDWVWGIAAHPDGYYLLGAFRYLLKVTPTGVITEVATWRADTSGAGRHDLALVDIKVDRRTGETHLFGAAGGYATWTEADGLDWKRKDDLLDPPQSFVAATSCDEGVYVWATDAASGEAGVMRWDKRDFAFVGTWSSSWIVDSVVCEGETGDFYLLAHGGWAQQVWRMLADGSSVTGPLFDTGQVDPDRRFYTAGILWTQD